MEEVTEILLWFGPLIGVGIFIIWIIIMLIREYFF